jgi:hypothetical protein
MDGGNGGVRTGSPASFKLQNEFKHIIFAMYPRTAKDIFKIINPQKKGTAL